MVDPAEATDPLGESFAGRRGRHRAERTLFPAR
jgi:hypothetical protein